MSAIPYISGPGSYLINVAGESFYLGSFALLVGPRGTEAVYIEARAQLTLEDDNPHDRQAVKVTIAGHQIGHLPRNTARAFRRSVKYGAMSAHESFECAAIICGGWANEASNGNFGVRLDLNLED